MTSNLRISRESIVNQVEGNVISDMDGEKVMLSVESGKYYNLGETGGEIWGHMEVPISVNTIILSLINKYEINYDECEEQVILFLDHLFDEGLVSCE